MEGTIGLFMYLVDIDDGRDSGIHSGYTATDGVFYVHGLMVPRFMRVFQVKYFKYIWTIEESILQ